MVHATQFVIAVPDLHVSSVFYRDVLGFEVRELAPGWLLYVNGACRIMAGECPDALPPHKLGDHAYFAHFTVDDLDAIYQRALKAGVSILKRPTLEPWGLREFALRTLDGHRIMIAQPVAARPSAPR